MKINGKRFTAGLWDACLGKWGSITHADVIVISETLALVTLPFGLLFSPSSPSLPTHLTPGGTMSHFLPINLVAELPLLQESWTWGVCGGRGWGWGEGCLGGWRKGQKCPALTVPECGAEHGRLLMFQKILTAITVRTCTVHYLKLGWPPRSSFCSSSFPCLFATSERMADKRNET